MLRVRDCAGIGLTGTGIGTGCSFFAVSGNYADAPPCSGCDILISLLRNYAATKAKGAACPLVVVAFYVHRRDVLWVFLVGTR